MIDFNHPANGKLVANFESRRPRGSEREADPAKVDNPYYTLGTHPDLVDRLWDELGGVLPLKCRWILYGSPVLVHPTTGIVFGFAGGTLTYALRLPPAELATALRAGATTVHEYPAHPEVNVKESRLDLADIGPEWVFGNWLKGEEAWCRAAFEFAAR